MPTAEDRDVLLKSEGIPAMGRDFASREKSWAELGIEEKVERTRQVVKTQGQLIERQDRRMARLERMLKHHQHVDTGLVIPMGEAERLSFDGELIREKSSGQDWF